MNNHNSLRIIQISDCHLSADKDQQWYGRNPVQCLDQVVASINSHESDRAIVLATGDLSHDGSRQSYSQLFDSMASLKMPVHALPGNHDHHNNMQKLLNAGKIDTTSHFINDNWLVIMLDTVAPGEEYGYLADSEITRLEQLLATHQDKHILIAMHHPPLQIDCAWLNKINLLNSDTFLNVISGHNNIQAIISGHIHQDTDWLHHGFRFLSCPSTCHQFLPDSEKFAIDDIAPGYRWLELGDDGNITSGIRRVVIDTDCHAT